MQNYIQPGETITLTAPAGGVVSGTAYKIGALLVVATATVAATLPFEGKVTGVFELPKTTGQVWAEGDLLYWDDTTKKLTDVVAGGDLLVGIAASGAISGATVGNCRLNGIARHDGVSDFELEDNAVDTAAIQALAVTAAKAPVFVSAEQTGTAGVLDVAHGLGAVPALVLIAVTESGGAAWDILEGAHDATNVKVTTDAATKFKVFAWA